MEDSSPHVFVHHCSRWKGMWWTRAECQASAGSDAHHSHSQLSLNKARLSLKWMKKLHVPRERGTGYL